MKIVVTLEVEDEDTASAVKEDEKRFARWVQDALDKEWPYASMGSVRVVEIKPGD